MSGDNYPRSDLIDVSYIQLHQYLTTNQDAHRPAKLKEYLKPRHLQFSNVKDPFGKPSAESKKAVDSGSVTLPDGVVLRVENADKRFVYAISSKFNIDEIQALIMLRSYVYNEGMPASDDDSEDQMIEQLVEAIGPFYHAERIHLLRTLIPLFRAKENENDALHEVAVYFLPKVVQDGPKFALSLVAQYLEKTKAELPEQFNQEPRSATAWAKQNLREQLVLLEVLFWTMWAYVSCSGPLVVSIFEAAYGTTLGSEQSNSTLLLDEESRQLQDDCAAMWILITIEILELEMIGGDEPVIELSEKPTRTDVYWTSIDSVKRLHNIVSSNTDSRYSCTYLAWTYALARIEEAAFRIINIPEPWRALLAEINPPMHTGRTYVKDWERTWVTMSKTCVQPEVGLLGLLKSLLTKSPLFVTSVAWKTGSSVTDPNAIAYRSVLKGLITALAELVPVENIPNFDDLVDVWISLYGRSESASVAEICQQFWRNDWNHGIARRAIFDVARSRFPIQVKPLIRLLRAMTGSGFLDTDPLYTSDYNPDKVIGEERTTCARFVYYYLGSLSSYSQVVPLSQCTGAHALYERQTERYGQSSANPGVNYTNLRPIRLPGGSILPARSTGLVLNGDGADHVVIRWQHQHSGWKVILEILTDYVNRRRMDFGSAGGYQDVSFARRGASQPKTLKMQDIGMEMDSEGDDSTITDILDLVRSLIRGNPAQAETLMQALEEGEAVVSHTTTEAQPPGMVQLTTMILEEALSRSNSRTRSGVPAKLITSALSVLSALLAIPNYSNRVWLYIRSTTNLFGTDRSPGFASVALSVERATGIYTMTLALLNLVGQLFREAVISILPENAKLQQLKEEVLLRAARFVHTEIWVEHMSWKYAQLGDRFEIGSQVVALYNLVLDHSSPTLAERPFSVLSQSIGDILLFKATTSTINPIISSISSSAQVLRMLYGSRRHADIRRLLFLLQESLRLCRLILTHKIRSSMASRPCLLEQALCARVNGGPPSFDATNNRNDPIDVLANYLREKEEGSTVPLESAKVLCGLITSLSLSYTSPPTIIGHLSNPEAIVTTLVRITEHPYDELALRKTVWNFITLAVDKEPALATLFVSGKSRTPGEFKEGKEKETLGNGGDKGKGKEKESEEAKENGKEKKLDAIWRAVTALDSARETLVTWKELWDTNAMLLSCVLRFLDTVWQHALEHKAAVEPLRTDKSFWELLVAIACEEVGPVPTYETTEMVILEGIPRSSLHEAVQMHAYRTLAKSHATNIITRDIGLHLQLHGSDVPRKKPESYIQLETCLKDQDRLTDILSEAAPSSYAPELHDQLTELLTDRFVGLTLEQLEVQEPVAERDYGDNFAFSLDLLRTRLQAYPVEVSMDEPGDKAEMLLLSINLNLSLVHAESALIESWVTLLKQTIPYLRGDAGVRSHMLAIAASISFDVAGEKRGGDMMASIHGARLSLILALLEVTWFSSSDKAEEIKAFMELFENLRAIVLNEYQSPARSFLSNLPNPFHRPLLQIIYFCSKQARIMLKRPKTMNSAQRLAISQIVEAILSFVIESLRVVFIAARSRADIDLDRDMELLVAVFHQCTRPDIDAPSVFWLSKCQETDVIKASLELFVHIDLVGLSDLPLLLSRKEPLYSPHILLFHMSLVSHRVAAERFASEGVLSAYSNNFISSAISSGMIDVVLPELPGQRSPAHIAYCSMISIVATVISALGRTNHYFDADACGFVQLYGDQISRTLSWTIGDPITLPLLEEIDQVINLFYAIATSVPASAKSDPVVEKVLRVFTTRALHLLQQVNYAITHPNHLATLYEPVTQDERIRFEKAQSQPDPTKRSFVTNLIHRLYQISTNLVGTLVTISRADSVLSRGVEDWPTSEALIVPHSKVVLGEPASLGTLLELGNRSLDLLRTLVQRPPGQGATDPSALPGSYATALEVKQGVIIIRQNLEEILLYSVTQLAMWLSKPGFDAAPADSDMDENQGMDVSRPDGGKERRPRSMTMAERLRRGITGEMAGDLQSLLTKSKPILVASDTIIGENSTDLTQVLLNFLHERIGGSS
ncbi:Nucleoporin nup184 [Psilocybe cubensis]|uniref:Nucleoporin nup184 n=2 Tax=Psilocybe cubensis TaxID=181762 RepID=A0ACB8H2P2_PSICU|nr:Nucleoporin nup184 [Psilocybe cubensis]KAH9482136.1 Nucleoporin nup184 [Psilocybe cubensis]